ncbi:MarR family transcriptional regulator [Nocardioides sp. GY 10113]|uniref:MarR family winged helix-turn-helix transcriptional regulator n=1 Tax=Nocardioides sp. GY 10113 TaxID=2569761 RepID=UPI0010A7AC44|nr:MarR family transcriptional regulator [Nocardioides sp. GY 10113]TIC86323.1 MarR family transcriptional regulator [Nocardioides sp. GY 10113]
MTDPAERVDGNDRPDWADRHVARWRDHWADLTFEDDVEAIVVRIGRLRRHFQATAQRALAEVGLADHEYETLHQLMVRDTPGRASPSALAADLGISNAGMTGRLDALERAGWVRRTTSPEDRRRVSVEVTEAGEALWKRAIRRQGAAEGDVVHALDPAERAALAGLLRKLTLVAEGDE